GSRRHTFRVFFSLSKVDSDGICTLKAKLRDTQATSPPVVVLSVNGRPAGTLNLPGGAGDASVSGNPERGRKSAIQVPFSAKLLHAGVNELSIVNRSGSWMLYDSLALTASGGTSLGTPPDTAAAFDPPTNLILDKGDGGGRQSVPMHIVRFGKPTVATVAVDG